MLINGPDNYFTLLHSTLPNQLCGPQEVPDLVHLFVHTNSNFVKEMEKLAPLIVQSPTIIIWISWYKKSSGIETGATETIIRNYALENNLVEFIVCAIRDL